MAGMGSGFTYKAYRLCRSQPNPGTSDKRGEAPFSVDANLLHISAEGKVLEDLALPPEEYVFSRTVSPEDAPDTAEHINIQFIGGDPVALNGVEMSPATPLTELNRLGVNMASAVWIWSKTGLWA